MIASKKPWDEPEHTPDQVVGCSMALEDGLAHRLNDCGYGRLSKPDAERVIEASNSTHEFGGRPELIDGNLGHSRKHCLRIEKSAEFKSPAVCRGHG